MNVLSLFDGISCGQVALERAGLKINNYFASEIDKYAIKITQKNYPNTIQLGDVRTLDLAKLPKIDLLIGGSPCQDLSICKNNRKGLEGEKSRLFYNYLEALKITKPKFFLLENNESILLNDKYKISELIGCFPVMIDSALVSAQERKRLYWTNIGEKDLNLFGFPTAVIQQPKEKKLVLEDILESNVDEKYFYNYPLSNIDMSKQVCAFMDFVKYNMHKKVYNPKFKVHTLTTCGGGNTQKKVFDNGRARKMTPIEYERCQTLPDNYTEGICNTARYSACANGWTVDVIAHIFSPLMQREVA